MTVPTSRRSAFENAPMRDMIDILLRQFRRPLANHNVTLTMEDVAAIASAAAERQPLSDHGRAVRVGLVRVVEESETVLARWDLTFEQALQTEMPDIPGWETTAEFLDIANEKSNAELRIAAGSALVLALGDKQFVAYLFFLVMRPQLDEVSAVVARRILAFASHTEDSMNDDDWLERVRAWARG
jgi:phage tail protein X